MDNIISMHDDLPRTPQTLPCGDEDPFFIFHKVIFSVVTLLCSFVRHYHHHHYQFRHCELSLKKRVTSSSLTWISFVSPLLFRCARLKKVKIEYWKFGLLNGDNSFSSVTFLKRSSTIVLRSVSSTTSVTDAKKKSSPYKLVF